jgi:hypothetical protein
MDGVSAAASIIALVDITITTAKVIAKTYQAANEGPTQADHVADNIGHLLDTLERLRNGPAVTQAVDSSLAEMLKTCNADLSRMSQKLEAVRFSDQDKTKTKLKKALKSVFKEKEFKEFQTRISEYALFLDTRINLLNRFVRSTHSRLNEFLTRRRLLAPRFSK